MGNVCSRLCPVSQNQGTAETHSTAAQLPLRGQIETVATERSTGQLPSAEPEEMDTMLSSTGQLPSAEPEETDTMLSSTGQLPSAEPEEMDTMLSSTGQLPSTEPEETDTMLSSTEQLPSTEPEETDTMLSSTGQLPSTEPEEMDTMLSSTEQLPSTEPEETDTMLSSTEQLPSTEPEETDTMLSSTGQLPSTEPEETDTMLSSTEQLPSTEPEETDTMLSSTGQLPSTEPEEMDTMLSSTEQLPSTEPEETDTMLSSTGQLPSTEPEETDKMLSSTGQLPSTEPEETDKMLSSTGQLPSTEPEETDTMLSSTGQMPSTEHKGIVATQSSTVSHIIESAGCSTSNIIKNCTDVTTYGNVTGDTINFYTRSPPAESKVRRLIKGTLAQGTLLERIDEATDIFVPTETFKTVQRKLDRFGHVTICGASGEGKTTMSLILATDYIDRGFEVLFVEKTDIFDINECIDLKNKLLLIFDDIFGILGLSTNIPQIKLLLLSLNDHINGPRKSQKMKRRSDSNRGQKDIRVVFTSKTYNFNVLEMSMFGYESMSMFRMDTVVELTADKNSCYSGAERVAIFHKHKELYAEAAQNISNEFILNLDKMLFGFPLTCKLFFELTPANPKDFFRQPLHYLKQEIESFFYFKKDKFAAITLMLFCENKVDLSKLETEGKSLQMDEMFKRVNDIVPSITRSDVAKAVREFRGTFFTRGDIVQFAHSSFHDASAYVLYEKNQDLVLQYCSLDFLYERLKSGTETDDNKHLHFIYISEVYHDVFADRLVQEMQKGNFFKTATHSMLESEEFATSLITKLKTSFDVDQNRNTPWMHSKDKDKGLLYWAVLGPSSSLVDDIVNEFAEKEIIEALDACVEKNGTTQFTLLSSSLVTEFDDSTKNRLLLLSAEHGSLGIAQWLIGHGANIQTSNSNKQNYLHIACLFGKNKMLTALETEKNQQLAIDAKDNNGRNPAMIAAITGSLECFELLMPSLDFDAQDSHRDSLIHLACQGGNIGIIQHVLTSNINNRGEFGWTPIMKAAAGGHQSAFEFLKSNNADFKLIDYEGDSLLHLACQGGNIDIVKHVFKLSDIDSPGQYGWTPLMNSAAGGHKIVFDFLVSKNADLRMVNNDGDSIIHLACQGGNKDIVEQVLTLMPSNINCKGENGWTPVLVSVAEGHQSVFDCLVEQGADLTLEDNYGDSIQHLACQGGNVDIIKHVVKKDNINSTGQHEWTPIMNAAAQGHRDAFDFLVQLKANTDMVDRGGNSLLHLACQGGNWDIVKYLLSHSGINCRNTNDCTPICMASAQGHQSVFDLLVSRKADLTVVDKFGTTLLHYACRGGSEDIVKQLLKSHSINIDGKGRNDQTPLMAAAKTGHKDIVMLLIEEIADITLTDDSGRNVFDIAVQEQQYEVVRYLQLFFGDIQL